jgi:hypothetical protein
MWLHVPRECLVSVPEPAGWTSESRLSLLRLRSRLLYLLRDLWAAPTKPA